MQTLVRKPRDRRIGITREGRPGYKHLLTVVINGDGGVIITPAQPARGWLLTERDQQGAVVRKLRANSSDRPRLHYHASGLTTLHLPDNNSDRVRVQLPRLESVTRRQIFALRQSNISQCPKMYFSDDKPRQPRSGDAFVVAHGDWPAAVTVTGVLMHHATAPWLGRSYLKAAECGDGMPPLQLVPGRQQEQILDLRGRGIPSFLVFRYHLYDFAPQGAATTTLAGLCGHRSWPSPLVVAATLDGAPKVDLLNSEDLPHFPHARQNQSVDRVRAERHTDGQVVYGEQV